MTFNVEIVLRERDYAVTEQIPAPGAGRRPRRVERRRRRAAAQGHPPGDRSRPEPQSTQRYVALRGFSWIVEPTPDGVVIAIEIPMGAAVAGPFPVEQAVLDRTIRRVIAAASPHKPVVH